MSQATFSLTYAGGIREGFDAEAVKAKVIEVLRLDPAQGERMFSGRPVVLRNGLGEDDALRYCARLNALGMSVALRADRDTSSPATDSAVADGGATATPSVPGDATEDMGERLLPFEFRGDGAEFFRIWIVNILLSIVTLGIYSAWAKVRTLRYFYGNTRLDGSSFEYHGDPVKILKGRLIAFALLLFYGFAGEISVWLGLFALAVLLLAMPWIVRSGLRFRNHNSSWRGVRFGFDGTLADAYKAWLMWGLFGVLSLGLLMPFAFFMQLRYSVEGGRFGTTRFLFDGTVRPVYMIFLAAAGCLFAGGLLFGFVGVFTPSLAFLFLALGYLSAYVVFRVWITNYRFEHSRLGVHRFEADYAFQSYGRLMLVNTLGVILTLGLFYPWAKVRSARYAAEHIRVIADGSLDQFIATQQTEVDATGGGVGELFDFDLGF